MTAMIHRMGSGIVDALSSVEARGTTSNKMIRLASVVVTIVLAYSFRSVVQAIMNSTPCSLAVCVLLGALEDHYRWGTRTVCALRDKVDSYVKKCGEKHNFNQMNPPIISPNRKINLNKDNSSREIEEPNISDEEDTDNDPDIIYSVNT